jgi:methenyltetrahydrofolate cyclohydrolase
MNKPDPNLSESFTERLSAGNAAPGGGAASAYAAAMAAALLAMSARLTLGRAADAERDSQMRSFILELERKRIILEEWVHLDEEAFEAVMAAYRMAGTEAEQQQRKDEEIEKAMIEATLIPLQVASASAGLIDLAHLIAKDANRNTLGDIAAALNLAAAALKTSGLNVRINSKSISDEHRVRGWLQQIDELEAQAASTKSTILKIIGNRVQLQNAKS